MKLASSSSLPPSPMPNACRSSPSSSPPKAARAVLPPTSSSRRSTNSARRRRADPRPRRTRRLLGPARLARPLLLAPFTLRQERYSRALGGEVYTPQLVVDGREQVLGNDPAAVRERHRPRRGRAEIPGSHRRRKTRQRRCRPHRLRRRSTQRPRRGLGGHRRRCPPGPA